MVWVTSIQHTGGLRGGKPYDEPDHFDADVDVVNVDGGWYVVGSSGADARPRFDQPPTWNPISRSGRPMDPGRLVPDITRTPI